MDAGGERARRTRHDAMIFAESESEVTALTSDDDGSRSNKRRRGAPEVARAGVLSLDGQLRRGQEKAASLAREQERMSKQEAEQKRQLRVMETIAGALEQVRADDASGVLTLEGLLLAFRSLKARFGVEFKVCGVAWIACQFAHPLLIRFFQGWQPLQDPSVGLEVMPSWKDLLEGDQPYDFSHGAASMAPYPQLVSEIICHL